MRKKSQGQFKHPRPKLSRLLSLVVPGFYRYRYRLLLGLFALLSVDFLQLTIPGYLKNGVDALASGMATSSSLLLTGGYILSTAAVIVILRFCWRVLIIGFSRHLEKMLRNKLFSHILEMDRPFFDSHTTGDIMAHATNDLSAVQMACGMGMVAAIDAAVMSMAALFFMSRLNFSLTFIAILPMPLLALSTWVLSAKLHKRFDLVQQQFSLLTEFSRSTMVSIRLIKAYTREGQQVTDFNRLSKRYVDGNLKVAVIQGLLFPVSTLVGNIGMLLVLYFGGRLVINHSLTLGEFVAFITYLYMLLWPMMAVGWVTNLVQRGLTSLTRIHNLLDVSPVLQANPGCTDSSRIVNCSFTCRNLSFSYPGSSRQVLTDVSLEIQHEIIGIAGKTGSGKTTLCRLLTRQYPVKSGMLFFSGHDVNSFSPDAVWSQISYVSQSPVLFSGTLEDNICLAVPDASMASIEKVAKMAAIHEEILAMPNGYKTRIGERGLRLSGGQKQRIAIARALLADREMIIIDDALSALDVATEQEVLRNIREQLKNKTVLIVSHRLKLLSCTDRVVIFDKGRIIDQGTHEQLLQRNDFYQVMAAKQQGGGHA